jgi:hypothetical protein
VSIGAVVEPSFPAEAAAPHRLNFRLAPAPRRTQDSAEN